MVNTFWKKIGVQFVRFGLSGGVGVLLGYVTLYLLTEFAGLWYIFSSIVANILNGGVNFFLEKFWTFRNKDTSHIYAQVGLYTALRLSLFGADVGLLYLLVEYGHMHYLIAQIFVTVVLSIVSFIVCRKIFLDKEGVL